MHSTPLILIVGAADTGRAPMAAALLRRLLVQRGLGWRVESAGILGHDGDPAEAEARSAMTALGLDLSMHQARSLLDALVEAATLLVVVDSGTARVVRMRYPDAPVATLGELAGRQRDIPDPFRMQIGAWLSYANEIERLLKEGLERLMALVGGRSAAQDTTPRTQPPPATPPEALPSAAGSGAEARSSALSRCERLLTMLRDMPALLEWANVRRGLEAEVNAASEHTLVAGDLVQSYAAMLLALLGLAGTMPTAGQIELLLRAVERLKRPIDQATLTALASDIAAWAGA